jgi:putative endopeptidase
MKRIAPALTLPLLLATFSACSPAAPDRVEGPPAPPPTTKKVKEVSLADVGLDGNAMDRSVDPCEDFYRYSCGKWVDSTEIPADQPRWNRSFSEIHEQNEQELKAILEAAALAKSGDPAMQKLGDFYAGCMDEGSIEKAGIAALEPYLKQLDAFARGGNEAPNLEAVIADMHAAGIWALFDVDKGQDFKDATKMIMNLDQNGLGLPDRDYYLKDDDKSKELRATYVAHVERMLALLGMKKGAAATAAADVMALETAIAKISKTRVERRDPQGMYNKIDQSGLAERSTGFDWSGYLKIRKLEGVKDISVTSIPFVEGLGKLMKETKRPQLASYLKWHLVHVAASVLSKKFVDEDFALTKALTGQDEIRPRWKRCVEATDGAMGELLAQPYVAKRFSAESKQAVEMMVEHIGKAMGANLDALPWMDAKTKERAKKKLATVAFLIGYPDKWKSYDFEVARDQHAKNMLAATRFDIARELAKIGKPVDRGEWLMSPPTVNAYYHPLRNQMVFPAGILQPPFFTPTASHAVNLGGMGMVVGHELTHGFDDKGSQFDADGNLANWWEPEVRKTFDERASCMKDQFSGYEVLPGVKLNGELTLGENIADAGGVKLAFRAYRAIRTDAPEQLVADGFDEDKQFFLSVGQVWCSKYREEFARMRASTDTHSQPNWRVNGSLRNTPEFAETFQCKEGSGMRPASTCSVW